MKNEELKSILSLDIATRTGFAFGKPGEKPLSGSIRCAASGASNGEIGRGFALWFLDFVTVSKPDMIYYEVPIDPRHMGARTTFPTARILLGLPFLLESLATMRGIYKMREAGVQDVRKYFLGQSRPKDKKEAVISRCYALGWQPEDDNAADALALWAFACAVEAPRSSIETAPLFSPKQEADEPPLSDDEINDIAF